MKAVVQQDAASGPSFREYLRQELAARCARNPQYSLRAFAVFLGVHHSTLSQVMRGKRTVTRAIVEKFGYKLGLAAGQMEQFLQAEAALPVDALEATTRLARDTAEVLEDWRNFAILELTRLDDFEADSRWIARMLGITVDEVNVALSRLCRLHLLRMDGAKWQDQLGDVVMDAAHFHEAAMRNLLERVLPVQASATVAIPASAVPAAQQRIAAFSKEFLEWVRDQAGKDEVYRFEVRFAPLTQR